MRKLLISLMLTLTLFSSVMYAVIPVEDVGLIWVTEQNHYQTILRWVEQIKQATETVAQAKRAYDYRVLIDGKWKSVIALLPSNRTNTLCAVPVKIENLGWDAATLERLRRVATVRSAIGSLEEFKRIEDATAPNSTQARKVLETIWGDVPVTREGVKVEGAYREIATVIDGIGGMNKAITEVRLNIQNLERNIASGAFTPVEMERQRAQLDVERARSNLLLAQSNNYQTRLLVQQTGMQAGQIVQNEQARLRGIERMGVWMGKVQFSPKSSNSRGVD